MKREQENMTSMNVSLPESLRSFVERRAASGFGSASEYIRELIRRDQREAAKQEIETLLLEGLKSGEPFVVTREYWEKKKADLLKRSGTKRRG